MLALSVYGCKHFIITESFSFYFLILLPGERLKGTVVFLIGNFLLSTALFVIARSN